MTAEELTKMPPPRREDAIPMSAWTLRMFLIHILSKKY